jgi:membrane fusion protein (multidrug efflux system)
VISGGLRAGDRIITQGTANLRDGAELRPVPASSPQRIQPGTAGAGAAGRAGQGR